jgi:hypothetical protein
MQQIPADYDGFGGFDVVYCFPLDWTVEEKRVKTRIEGLSQIPVHLIKIRHHFLLNVALVATDQPV